MKRLFVRGVPKVFPYMKYRGFAYMEFRNLYLPFEDILYMLMTMCR